eukprot:4513610-Prymnesium_polylepis.1
MLRIDGAERHRLGGAALRVYGMRSVATDRSFLSFVRGCEVCGRAAHRAVRAPRLRYDYD